MPLLMLYTLTGFLIMFIILEIIPLSRKREWKQLIVTLLLFGLTLLYGLDYAMMANILPNPNKTLYYFKPISESFERVLNVNT